ncbi:aldehyde dehydrogenase [Amycolatopsis sp. GM8]|uniref:aldehyde dehydrogenase n=1 Tax=Amycolatopsis sp. GM8 TaxID=2896530 RepID=UPI001F440540|nr:aldehyde dehydrogenase [Amycolatopsis sp. GM8]
MTLLDSAAPLRHANRFYLDGRWETPSSDSGVDVIDATTELPYLRVAAARPADMARAIAAARRAFDEGPWPRLTHEQRAEYLRAMAGGLRARSADFADIWPRESGILHELASYVGEAAARRFEFYANLASTFAFEEPATPTAGGDYGLLVREPVGVVAAIIPWNAPLPLIAAKVAPALLAGCTVVLKPAPEAPGEAYVVAEIAEAIGLPPGVLNVLTAQREASEALVRDPRVDKVTFTGSTTVGRRIAALCGERIARVTLELGGKSAAVVLDDCDLEATARAITEQGRFLSGQVCSSLTRVVVTRRHHDELVAALAANLSAIQVGDPFRPETQMGPLALGRQRDAVERYVAIGLDEGATLVTGGGRPEHLDHGWYVEPTLFAGVGNRSTIAQAEIFGPVLSVVPVADEDEAIAAANDSIYGLNASVFTGDVDRAQRVARRLRSGTVGHNAWRSDYGVAFGGFKQSGIGREGGKEGLLPYLETKFVILDGAPSGSHFA